MVMFLCGGCAEKIGTLYETERIEGSSRRGKCPLCYGIYAGDSYRIRKRGRKAYAGRTGGGERSRAGK